MSNLERTQFCPIYVGPKKVATLQSTDVQITMNGEELFGSEGLDSISDGAITTKVDGDTIVPTSGVDPDIVAKLINRDDVTIGIKFYGDFLKCGVRFMSVGQTSNSKSGATTGKFSCQGGKPEIVSI